MAFGCGSDMSTRVGSESRDTARMAVDDRITEKPAVGISCLEKFNLYQTQSKYYMIGRNKNKTLWRVLKIDRSEPSEQNIHEDPSMYTVSEFTDLLKRINEGNMSTGGLRFVTKCYGIVGFVKFLGPYYMLLITERRKIGVICGQTVYAVSKSKIIELPNSTVRLNLAYSKDENRYKKLLCTVDLTKDFFFSYSYYIMRSLQKNLSDGEIGQVLYETMFVWNEFLTRGIRNHLKNTMWTVALVYGFFKQTKLSISGKHFTLTLIARRSRHFAGTRYLKRGVNEKGRVANDVETEQIVFEDTLEEIPTQISSVVQHRGSIPLFWSQDSSWLNIKPDIILHEDQNYEATRLHFNNLVKRYGNPIFILNLTKTQEKKPRESILCTDFAKATEYINENLSTDNCLRFIHFDLHGNYQRMGTKVLTLLGKVAAHALRLTGFFYCQVPPALRLQGALNWPVLVKDNAGRWSYNNHNSRILEAGVSGYGSQEDKVENYDFPQNVSPEEKTGSDGNCLAKPSMFQNGVLRTNCIDCLDRTNVAQFAYGLAALGHQLSALGFISFPKIDIRDPLADDLMSIYESMGDTLALQYGGSAAHNKIFSEIRGQWKPATQSQEFFRTLRRYYNNAYMDAVKQDAINVFLEGKPELWELHSDQHYNIRRWGHFSGDENARPFIQRSLSDGNILCESNEAVSSSSVGERELPNSGLPVRRYQSGDANGLCDSTPESLTCEIDISYSRYTPIMYGGQLFADSEHNYSNELRFDVTNSSNSLDLDRISSSANSCEEEIYDRSPHINSLAGNLSTENCINGMSSETATNLSDNSIKGMEATEMELSYNAAQRSDVSEFSESFVNWVLHEEASLLSA